MVVLAINGGERGHTSGWPTWPPNDPGFLAALKDVLDSGTWSIQGEFVERSAEAMARFHDAQYAVRYDREAFDGLPCATFTAALRAEGIPGRQAYNPLYKEGVFGENWDPNAFPFARPFYSGAVDYREVHCPACEHLCEDGAFLMPQWIGLADERAIHDIADAIAKVQKNVPELE